MEKVIEVWLGMSLDDCPLYEIRGLSRIAGQSAVSRTRVGDEVAMAVKAFLVLASKTDTLRITLELLSEEEEDA